VDRPTGDPCDVQALQRLPLECSRGDEDTIPREPTTQQGMRRLCGQSQRSRHPGQDRIGLEERVARDARPRSGPAARVVLFVPPRQRRNADTRVDRGQRRQASIAASTSAWVSGGTGSTATATGPSGVSSMTTASADGVISIVPSRSTTSTSTPAPSPRRSRIAFGTTIRPAPSMVVRMVLNLPSHLPSPQPADLRAARRVRDARGRDRPAPPRRRRAGRCPVDLATGQQGLGPVEVGEQQRGRPHPGIPTNCSGSRFDRQGGRRVRAEVLAFEHEMVKNLGMGPRFRPVLRDQLYLLPEDVREWVPSGHPSLFVAELVEELDLSEFYGDYTGTAGRGRPAYHPVAMVGILLYASMTAEDSS